jgi:hypothetical protein
MKLDTMLSARDLHEVPKAAKAAEDAGFDAIWSMEAGTDGSKWALRSQSLSRGARW